MLRYMLLLGLVLAISYQQASCDDDEEPELIDTGDGQADGQVQGGGQAGGVVSHDDISGDSGSQEEEPEEYWMWRRRWIEENHIQLCQRPRPCLVEPCEGCVCKPCGTDPYAPTRRPNDGGTGSYDEQYFWRFRGFMVNCERINNSNFGRLSTWKYCMQRQINDDEYNPKSTTRGSDGRGSTRYPAGRSTTYRPGRTTLYTVYRSRLEP